ncbi:nucleolysin TIAR-like [Odontomachus brunneus]|uniref:nucleolysin TIAR-like n=1 Tax=Odontomachus brunneus TaxID=486640 RepID=UPI0013F248A9|nr:nucleolysin TIAR-like [Odontomachus brunneus]
MSDDITPKTLYVGNLDHVVCEDLLCALFSHIGTVTSCKIIREPRNDPYAFVEFADHAAASAALTALNQRLFLEKLLQLEWALLMDDEKRRDVSRRKKSGEMREGSR